MGIINRNQGRGTSVTSGGAVYRSLEATVYGLVSQEEAEDTSDLSPVLIDKDLKLWAPAAEDPGEALPEGGTTGQVLAKASDDDYDVEWIDASEEVHGIPSGGSSGQVLKKASGTDYDAEWGAIPNDLPSGGSTGQVLAKASGTDYDAGWQSPHYVPAGGSSGQVLKKTSGTDYDVEWGASGGSVPTPSVSDYGKVLSVNISGNPEWVPADVLNGAISFNLYSDVIS